MSHCNIIDITTNLKFIFMLPWRLSVLPATVHIACYSWCRLNIDLIGLVQHQVIFVLELIVLWWGELVLEEPV